MPLWVRCFRNVIATWILIAVVAFGTQAGVVNLSRLYDFQPGATIKSSELDAEYNQLVNELADNSIPDFATTWPATSEDGRIIFHKTAEDLLLDDGTNVYGLNTIKVTGGAGGVLAYDTVYVSALGAAPTVLKGDADVLATSYVLGVMIEAVAAASTGACRIRGPIVNSSWAWTGLTPIYLSQTAGALTQTAPSPASGARVIVGFPLSVTAISIQPQIVMEY